MTRKTGVMATKNKKNTLKKVIFNCDNITVNYFVSNKWRLSKHKRLSKTLKILRSQTFEL